MAVELGDAVDAPSLTWTTSGSVSWAGVTDVSSDGVDSAASGVISDSQESRIETAVTGPGTLTYQWKVSSEAGYDFLTFSLDGVEQWRISGESTWAKKTVVIPAGVHTLLWKYIKDDGASEGADQGWLDDVVYTPVVQTEVPGNVTAGENDSAKVRALIGLDVADRSAVSLAALRVPRSHDRPSRG